MEENFKTLVQSKTGLRMVSSTESHRSAFEMVLPLWSLDSDFVSCFCCQSKFDFMTRRHHCRRCGLVFCNNCCNKKSPHPRMCFVDPVRLCPPCTSRTRKENDFFERYLVVLTRGSPLNVVFKRMPSESASDVAPQNLLLNSLERSSSDLTFFPPEEPFEPIDHDFADLSLGGDSRELRCALCPLHRNLIFTSTSRDDRRGQEMARFDLTQLTSCSLAQMSSDALQGGNNDSFPTTSSSPSLASSQAGPDVTSPFPNGLTLTFGEGGTSGKDGSTIVTLAPVTSVTSVTRGSRDEEQQLRWMKAFRKASHLIINSSA